MEKLVAVKSNKISAQNFYDYIIFMFLIDTEQPFAGAVFI